MAILRDFKKGELTLKDMSVMRENKSAREQKDKDFGELTDYTMLHRVSMTWGFEKTRNLLPVVFSIDGKKFTLSWAELRDLDREGFFRVEDGLPRMYKPHYLDGPKVTIDTDLNEEAQRDRMVRFNFGGEEVILDWYQCLMLGRFV